jgi:hypothetical protein
MTKITTGEKYIFWTMFLDCRAAQYASPVQQKARTLSFISKGEQQNSI